ncbi:hypothetical protein [Streptomyces sp. T028]|uniref:hypothetical protein n=1 Tax=Streptomyces sp. T028 TaxID=3394379 RepID=UPI003A8725DB
MGRLLRLVIAFGVLALAIGLGMVVDGNLGGGLALLIAGLLFAGVPAGVLIRHLRANWTVGYSPSPAMADPALRRAFRNVGVSVIVSSALWFVAAFVVLFAFYQGADDDASGGAIATRMVLGCFFAGIPALLGIQFLRCGQLLLHGDTDGTGGVVRLGWIVVVLGVLVVGSSLSKGQIGIGLFVGALVVMALVHNFWVPALYARVIQHGRTARGHSPSDASST